MFRKILVALDNSPMGEDVFKEAIYLAKATDACLLLLNVVSPSSEYYPHPFFTYPDMSYPRIDSGAVNLYMEQWEALKREGFDFLKAFCNQAHASGVETEFSLNFGDPGRVICDIASTWKAELIIVGRRGRRGLSEFLLGSVSNYVLHHAPCSVLTVQASSHSTTESP
jgi:nucleotide-binding universal stress UspA family protein